MVARPFLLVLVLTDNKKEFRTPQENSYEEDNVESSE